MRLSPNNDQGEYVGSNLNSQQPILSNRLLLELEHHGPKLMVSENSRMSAVGRFPLYATPGVGVYPLRPC